MLESGIRSRDLIAGPVGRENPAGMLDPDPQRYREVVMSFARTPVLAFLSTAVLAAPATFAQHPPSYEPGEKWRTTMSMSAMGMTMPGMSNEVCVPTGGDASQAGLDKNCRTSNMRRSGNKLSYHVVCTGKNAMEGDMEIENLGPDHYRGQMIATVEGDQMTMKYEGKKLPGECDAGEMKRKVNAMIAKSNAEMAKACREGAQNVQVGLFTGAEPMCKDPRDKQAFCSNVQGYKGFGSLSQQERYYGRGGQAGIENRPLTAASKACGFDVEAKRTQLCGSAEGKGEWVFLAVDCPVLAKPLAQRECAGRDFTTPVAPKYQDFCSAYASARSGAGAAGAAAGGDGGASGANGASGAADGSTAGGKVDADEQQKKSAGDKAKDSLKKLKGLFGR